MPLVRFALRNTSLRAVLPTLFTGQSISRILVSRTSPQRCYATKGKTKSTAKLVPGSKQPITDEAALAEYKKAETVMANAVDWFRKECQGLETRAGGRVTPALLSPARVKLHDKDYRLEEVATIGVRDGSILLLTLFDEKNMKLIEKALYDSKIPGVVPHRQDNRTIKIPIPKPTVDARKELYTGAKRKAEEIRVQIRKHHQASLKRGKYVKHSVEQEEFQKLTDRHIAEVDAVLASLQKATGASK
ncbi:Ribosome-recycling factor [Leucoagaricus sp. SymC.cos]|nr:Ribosome-recycling factor [Leucoagaricus sp. SymC.cos]